MRYYVGQLTVRRNRFAKVPSFVHYVRVSQPRLWEVGICLYTKRNGSLTHSTPTKVYITVLLASLPLYANCLCVMLVFSYANNHTISILNPLPIFQDTGCLSRGVSRYVACLVIPQFFHSSIITGLPTLCVR